MQLAVSWMLAWGSFAATTEITRTAFDTGTLCHSLNPKRVSILHIILRKTMQDHAAATC